MPTGSPKPPSAPSPSASPPTNDLGALDHDVDLPTGTFHNPMRVIPNGTGSEVLFTLIQLPDVSDEQFQQDMDTVRADLNKLRTVLEHLHPTPA